MRWSFGGLLTRSRSPWMDSRPLPRRWRGSGVWCRVCCVTGSSWNCCPPILVARGAVAASEVGGDSGSSRLVNPEQARALLAAVREHAAALEAFFGCLYYAALRPAEARHLRDTDLVLPGSGWGELTLTGSTQEVGHAWSDSGSRNEDRGLKHRPVRDTRIVPACPELVQLLRPHIDQFGPGQGGRLFVTRTGRFGRPVAAPYSSPVSTNTYTRVWRKARGTALAPAQVDSPLAARPYDLRHACVSLWLNAGSPRPGCRVGWA
jgi:integrase